MLIYDKYTEEYYNVIPVKNVEEKIKELNKHEKEETKGLKGQDRYSVKQEYMFARGVLQQLIKENTEEE